MLETGQLGRSQISALPRNLILIFCSPAITEQRRPRLLTWVQMHTVSYALPNFFWLRLWRVYL